MGLFPGENTGTYMDGSFFCRNMRRAYHCNSAESGLLDPESANPARRLSLMSNGGLMDLMGDSQAMPMNNKRAPPQEVMAWAQRREGGAGTYVPYLIQEKIRGACSRKMIC